MALEDSSTQHWTVSRESEGIVYLKTQKAGIYPGAEDETDMWIILRKITLGYSYGKDIRIWYMPRTAFLKKVSSWTAA